MNSKFIQSRIDAMPPEDLEACNELAEHIRRCAACATPDVALHAVHLISFELLEKNETTNQK